MKIAILSDIHGNHYALSQVLKDAKINKVERLLVLGDFVGYYYYPERVLSLLDNWDYEIVRGNHEVLLQRVLNDEIELSTLTKKYGSGHKLAIKKLTHKQLEYLINAPDKKEITFDKVKILICHGSSWDPNYYLYPNTDKKILNKTGDTDADFVFVGHSHHPFMHKNDNNILINVGSVGQSRQRGGVANWVILNLLDNSIEVKETDYDINPLISDVKKIDPENEYLISVLKRNNSEK